MKARGSQDSAMEEEVLRFDNMLKEPHELVSDFERGVAQALTKAGLEYEYEPYTLWVEVGMSLQCEMHLFVPRFRITNAKLMDKEIVIEPVSAEYIDDFILARLNAFMGSEEHDGRYLLFITDMGREELTTMLRLISMEGMELDDIADEVWFEALVDGTSDGSSLHLDKEVRELAGRAMAGERSRSE